MLRARGVAKGDAPDRTVFYGPEALLLFSFFSQVFFRFFLNFQFYVGVLLKVRTDGPTTDTELVALAPLLSQFPTHSMAAPVAVAAAVGSNSILGAGVYSASSDYNLSSSSSLPAAARTHYGFAIRGGPPFHELATVRRRPMSPSLQCLSRSRPDSGDRHEENATNTNLSPEALPPLRQ